MDLLYVLLFTVFITAILMIILLIDSEKSDSIKLEGKKLIIWYPLKKEVINLDSDLKGWSVQKINKSWEGKLYFLNLQLKSGELKKVYSKSRDGRIGQLIQYLEKTSGQRQLKV